ncbi:MAG: DUF58 domain-containing protein [Chloroflexi bacterium]|nr:DUF58 domain-containing protein [Chloroflexota bacterium]
MLVLIFALVLLGLATLNGGIVALAMPLVIYLAVARLRMPEAPRLRVGRSLSLEHTSPGVPVVVKLDITNEGAPLDELRVEDVVCPGLEVIEGETSTLGALPSGGRIELAYTVRGNRGEFNFDDLHIRSSDSLGLFEQFHVLSAPAYLLIRPQVRRLRPVAVRPPRTRGFAGPIPARQSGSGVDFIGLREYQMGDRLRWMNWRVSARHEQNLFTNQFEQERIADVGLILDARQQNDVLTSDGSLFDHAIQATASLADTFLEAGNRVGLLIYGRGREGVFPGYGHVQRERIFRALGRTAAGHNYALESLYHLPTRFFPAHSQIVFIGPLNGGDDVAVLTRLRANGYAVMVVSPDPVAFEMQGLIPESNQSNVRRTDTRSGHERPAITRMTGTEYANRLSYVERRLALLRLKRVGVQVIDWRVDQPLDQALATASPRGNPSALGREARA